MEFKFYLLCEFEIHKQCRDDTYGKWVEISHGKKLYRFTDAESRTNAKLELSYVYQNVWFTEIEAEVF